jgi:hypothetical protein
MTPREIKELIMLSDTVTAPDQLPNREKVNLICAVFDVASIDLSAIFDFDGIIATEDPQLIFAGLQLASLQFEYITRMHMNGHMAEDEHERVMNFLHLAKGKLRWASSFRRFGGKVPPYPFVN